MLIIQTNPNENGSHPPIQCRQGSVPPDEYSIVADNCDTAVFYNYNSFVTFVPDDDNAVHSMTANVEAWEAWKASLPPEQPPTPTPQEDTDAMLVDHEYRLTLVEIFSDSNANK